MRRRKYESVEADVLFDPADLAEEAIRSNLDPAVFEQIDERDIAWPRNWFEWVHSSRYLNVNPFAKQVEICTNLYGQFCPQCTDERLVAQDEHWGNSLLLLPLDMSISNIQDRVTFLHDGKCPQCGVTKGELVEKGRLSHYLNLAGCAGQRCVAGDTVLFTSNGVQTIEALRTDDVPADTFQPLNIPVASLGTVEAATHHYTSGIGPAADITVRYGYHLTGSPKHPVRVLRRDGTIVLKELQDVREDDAVHMVSADIWGSRTELPPLDIVAAPAANQNITIPRELTPSLARVLGNLVANGTVTSACTITFSVSDVAVRDRYIADTAALFNLHHYRTATCLEEGATVEEITFCSVLVRRFLEQIGLSRVRAASKQVPSCILSAPKQCVLAFLAGLLDCDGGVYHGKGRKKASVTYTFVSERLARQVHMLCLNAGVWLCWDAQPSMAFNSRRPLGHDAYSMTTKSLADAKRFLSLVPLVCTEKATAARGILAEQDNRGPALPNTRACVIELLDAIVSRERALKQKCSSKARPFRHVRKAGDITRNNLRRLLTVAVDHRDMGAYRKLEAVLDAPGRFMPVKQVETKLHQPLYDLQVPNGHLYVANGVVGHNSSKTVIAGGLIATYQLVRYLQLPSPSKHFNLMANQMLHGTFTAVTAGQAYDTLWEAFKARVDNAPWFAHYHDFLKSEAGRLGKDELFDVKDTYLWYGHKQLSFSYCGPDIRTIRGRTRIFTSIDEVAWYDVKAEGSSRAGGIRLNAEETSQALLNSLRTIRAAAMKLRQQGHCDPPDGINADVSSPSSINDFIMRSLRTANTNASTYGFHYATWEMNPNVPIESLRDQMHNPQNFERDYGAVPPLGANQFISSISSVEKCETERPQTQFVTWQQERFIDDFGTQTTYLSVRPSARDKSRPRVITIDTGLTNNSFAILVMSYDRDNRRPVVDVALECMPERADGDVVPVNFPLMYEQVLERIIQSFWVCLVVCDRWQSVDQMQRIRKEHKIETVQYCLKWADFQMVRSRILDSSLSLPRFEVPLADVRKDNRPFEQVVTNNPVTHLALQILTVREGGRKVIKPLNGTDDLFRCLCLGITFMLDPKYTPRFERYGGAMTAGRRIPGTVRLSRSAQVDRPRLDGATGVGVHKPFGTGRLT